MIPVVLAAAALAASPFAPNNTGLVLLQIPNAVDCKATWTDATECGGDAESQSHWWTDPGINCSENVAACEDNCTALCTAAAQDKGAGCCGVDVNAATPWCVYKPNIYTVVTGNAFYKIKMICESPASASGDPHMVNVLGEHFNLWRLGEVELLKVKVPRGATVPEPEDNFSMKALVKDFGGANYITSVSFNGFWFDRPVFVDMIDGNLVPFVSDQELQRQSNPLVIGRMSESRNVSVHMPKDGHVVIRIGGATIDVVRDVRPIHFFLNVQAQNLSELGDNIGGILGTDDHSDVAKKPDYNKNAVVFRRVNGAATRGSSASASLGRWRPTKAT